MTSFTRQYSFPNVSVIETVRGPQQFTSVWRNTIGVAAPFNKGPLIAQISSRQELVNLYGEDNSLGSIAVRQAMLQGATNFVISRALPKAKGAYGVISFTNADGSLNVEPLIGSNDNRTVGLTVDFSFISPLITPDKDIIAYAESNGVLREVVPKINTGDFLNNLDFEGIGSLVLRRVRTISKENYYFFQEVEDTNLPLPGFEEIAASNLAVTAGEQIFKLVFLKADVTKNNYIQAFMPGMRIESGTGGPTFEGGYGTIISELENEDDLNYSVYVKANITAAGTSTAFKLALPESVKGQEFPILDIYRLFFVPNSSEVLPGDVKYFGATSSTVNFTSLPIGYFVFNRHDHVGQTIPISYYTVNVDGTLNKVDTGVTYSVGNLSDNYANIIAQNQTINIAKSKVVLGEVNPDAPGFPNTDLAFAPNTPISLILNLLRDRLNSNLVLTALNADIEVNTSLLPYSLTIKLGVEGEIGNNIIYKVSRVSTGIGSSDINFEDNGNLFDSNINFIGGVDQVTPATKFFYNRQGRPVLYIEALSPGLSGNNIRVNIRPVDSSNFLLEVRELVPPGQKALPTESYYLSNTTVDLATGIYPETLSSKLIRAYYIPVIDAIGSGTNTIDFNQSPVRVAPPDFQAQFSDVSFETHPSHVGAQYTQNIALTGGSEPANYQSFVPEEAYLDAIDRLNDQDVAFIIAPGLVAGDVRYERAINSLIQQADQATPYNGLRIAILSAPPKLTPSRAELLNAQYSSPNLVIVGGWSSLATARGIGLNQYSPEGFYAGMLSVSDTYVSPASSFNNNFVVGVRNVDTDSRLAALDSYTNNNIEMLYVDRVSGKVKFLNGRTTAGNLDNRWVAIRRQSQHLIMNIVRNLEWARSAPNDPETRARVASAVDALMKTEQRRGAIAGFTPTSIDSSNPERIAQGFMDIVITWIPIFPADYINVELIRTISNQFSLQLNA